MVNFGALDTVPERYRGRNLYVHNPQVTLMRTTAEENAAIGRWIGERLERLPGAGPLPAARGRRLADRRAGQAVPRSGRRRRSVRGDRGDAAARAEPAACERLPFAINDPEFAAALVQAFREVAA